MNYANRDRAHPRRTVASRALGFARRSRQRGQAILWFLATTAACCAVLALVYNMGQVTNEKEKTINASDAAALSGALVEARMLNFIAYTNRAIIADEVTIAQLVSLDSWVRYLSQLSQNVATYTSWIPYVNDVTQTISDVMQQGAQTAADDAAQVGVPVIDGFINYALIPAEQVANAVGPLAAKDIASQIAQANKTTFATTFGNHFDTTPQLISPFDQVLFGLNEAAWLDFVKTYCRSNSSMLNCKSDSSTDDRGNAAQVILASRDQFSTHRDEGALFDSINLALGGPIFGVTGFDKTSGDTLLPNYDRWEAQDSLDLWVGVQVLGVTIYRAYISPPLGYGRVDADKDGSTGDDWDWLATFDSSKSHCPWPGTPNCELAYQNDAPVKNWSGIPEILDLATPGSSANQDPTLNFVAAVQKPAGATLTTQRLGNGMNNVQVPGPQGSPDLKDNLLGSKDELASISAARVFFARPDWNTKDITEGNLPRADHVHEYASLYNPYWQARLTDPDSVKTLGVSVKSLLYAALGNPGLNCAADPVSCLP